jgi:hypothetical protein
MKAASLSEIKKELQLLQAPELMELCLLLARYKKDNKEFLDYQLFRSDDKTVFVNEVKAEMDELFAEIGRHSNLYYSKKTLRKILRGVSKYCKYLNSNASSAELYIYFCLKMKNSGLAFRKSQQLVNMYEQQLKKINTLIGALHEDLRLDYAKDLEDIAL